MTWPQRATDFPSLSQSSEGFNVLIYSYNDSCCWDAPLLIKCRFNLFKKLRLLTKGSEQICSGVRFLCCVVLY